VTIIAGFFSKPRVVLTAVFGGATLLEITENRSPVRARRSLRLTGGATVLELRAGRHSLSLRLRVRAAGGGGVRTLFDPGEPDARGRSGLLPVGDRRYPARGIQPLRGAPPLLTEAPKADVEAFEQQLPPCARCGTRFLNYNPLRCPAWRAPQIDFARHPSERQAENYGNVLYGESTQEYEPDAGAGKA
jgi:hypothetical protein